MYTEALVFVQCLINYSDYSDPKLTQSRFIGGKQRLRLPLNCGTPEAPGPHFRLQDTIHHLQNHDSIGEEAAKRRLGDTIDINLNRVKKGQPGPLTFKIPSQEAWENESSALLSLNGDFLQGIPSHLHHVW